MKSGTSHAESTMCMQANGQDAKQRGDHHVADAKITGNRSESPAKQNNPTAQLFPVIASDGSPKEYMTLPIISQLQARIEEEEMLLCAFTGEDEQLPELID